MFVFDGWSWVDVARESADWSPVATWPASWGVGGSEAMALPAVTAGSNAAKHADHARVVLRIAAPFVGIVVAIARARRMPGRRGD
jgi:hypothetical protein